MGREEKVTPGEIFKKGPSWVVIPYLTKALRGYELT